MVRFELRISEGAADSRATRAYVTAVGNDLLWQSSRRPIGGEMKIGGWSFWKACLRVAPEIMGVGMAAMMGMAPQNALAASRVQHEPRYFLYVGTYTGHNSKGIY